MKMRCHWKYLLPDYKTSIFYWLLYTMNSFVGEYMEKYNGLRIKCHANENEI